MKNKVGLMDIKTALRDSRFRAALPDGLQPEVTKYLNNPGCSCNTGLYRAILRDCRQQLQEYFPDREITNEQEEIQKLAENHFSVINCSIGELEERLRKLPRGRKQIAICRFEDQVTAIVNELDIVY